MKSSKFVWLGIVTCFLIMCCLLPCTADANTACRDIRHGSMSDGLGEEFPELYIHMWTVHFGSAFPSFVLIGIEALGEEFPELKKRDSKETLGEEFPEKMESQNCDSLGEEFPE